MTYLHVVHETPPQDERSTTPSVDELVEKYDDFRFNIERYLYEKDLSNASLRSHRNTCER